MADNEVGFSRKEMYTLKLAGTANSDMDRHIFLVWGKAAEWPEKVPDECAEGSVPKVLGKALAEGKKSFKGKVKWTMVEAVAGDRDGDVLVFPDYVRFNVGAGPGDEGLKRLIEFLGKAPAAGKPALDIEELGGAHTFVCGHATRDARCGHCAPKLLDAIATLQQEGRFKDVHVRKCAHVGGHVYAGNAIVFSGRGTAEDGHWYGYVTPGKVASILSGTAARGPLWRGRLGVGPENQIRERRRKQILDSVPLALSVGLLLASIVSFRRRAR